MKRLNQHTRLQVTHTNQQSYNSLKRNTKVVKIKKKARDLLRNFQGLAKFFVYSRKNCMSGSLTMETRKKDPNSLIKLKYSHVNKENHKL